MEQKHDWFGFYTAPPFYVDGIPKGVFNHPDTEKNPFSIVKRLAEPVLEDAWGSYKLKISMDGLIAFHNDQLDRQKKEHLLAANAFHVLLLLEGETKLAWFTDLNHLGLYDLIELTESQDPFRLCPDSKAASPLLDRREAMFDRTPYGLGSPGRNIVRQKTLKTTIEKFKKCSSDVENLKCLSQLMKAFSEYGAGSYELGIVVSWFIVEKEIDRMWSDFCEEKACSKKQKGLLNNREFTASIKSNTLHLAGVIDSALIDLMNEVRGYRNNIVHKDHAYGLRECDQAIHLAMQMLELRLGVHLKIEL